MTTALLVPFNALTSEQLAGPWGVRGRLGTAPEPCSFSHRLHTLLGSHGRALKREKPSETFPVSQIQSLLTPSTPPKVWEGCRVSKES